MVKELHPRGLAPLSVFRTGALLLCQPSAKMVRVERIALPTSSFQARPSAADLHPDKEMRSAERGVEPALCIKMALAEGVSPSSSVLEAPRSGN